MSSSLHWIENQPGRWTSQAGVIVTAEGNMNCLATDVGQVWVGKGATLEKAMRAVETAYTARQVQRPATGDGSAEPVPLRRGRKPKGARPMTAAERQASQRERLRRKAASGVETVRLLGEPPKDPITGTELQEIWGPQRVEIHGWLQTQAPPLAAIYEEAVNLIHKPESPGRLYLVAHCMREIGNRLPGCLDSVPSGTVLYPELVKPVFELWERAGLPYGDNPFPPVVVQDAPVPGEDHIKLPIELARKIGVLLGEHAGGEARNAKKSEVLFNSLKREAGVTVGGSRSARKRWDGIRDWAVKNTHVGRQQSNVSFSDLRERFAEFEQILYALVGSFVDVLRQVDAVRSEAPLDANVERTIRLLGRGAARAYFFDRQNNPEWLQALDERNYFDELQDNEHWPEAAYLGRMASHEPERVTRIFERLTEKTQGVLDYYLIDGAIALPSSYAARLAKPIAKLIRDEARPFNGWHKLPKLIVQLATGGEQPAAFTLFDAMYSVPASMGGDDAKRVSFPGTTNDFWLLQEGLKSILPALVTVDAEQLIRAFCSKLKAALAMQGYLELDRDDSFIIAHRALGGEGIIWSAEYVHDLATLFAKALSRAATTAVRSGLIDASSVIDLIEGKQAEIFKHVVFHVLALMAPNAADKAIERMADPALYDDGRFEKLYGELLRARFMELSAAQQDSVLGWIRRGPDFETFTERWEKWRGAAPTAADWEAFRKGWLRKRLNWIPAGGLPAIDADTLSRIGAEVDPTEDNWSEFKAEPSPKTLEELRAMSPDEVADLIKAHPSLGGRGPTSGMATILPQVVQDRVAAFTGAARAFIGVHQTWIRSLLWGLDKSTKQGTGIEWEPLLALCEWAVEQPRGEEPRDFVGRGDVSWEGARGAVADVLRTGLQINSIPVALGPKVWAILVLLADDPDPVPPREQDGVYDPAMLSINSVRGKAMHAVVQYALWRRRQMDDNGVPGGFEAMPEVRDLLDSHLVFEREPSAAVRSVYAQFFPALVYLDEAWAEAAVPMIFPAGEKHSRYWSAAWSVYATFARSYDRVFDILKPTYEVALERMPWSEDPDAPRRADGQDWRYAEENVACHLLAFYWRGKLELDDEGMLVRYFTRFTQRARSKALWFVATSLASLEGEVPAEVQQRIMAFWDWWMAIARTTNGPMDRQELTTFGGWFAYGRLDSDWSARTLHEVLELVGDVDHPAMVIGRLAVITSTDLKCAVDGLKAFVKADREGWRHTMAKDDVGIILRAGLHSEETEIALTACGIVDKLAERGDLIYRELLP